MRRWVVSFILLLLLAGSTGLAIDVETLVAEGYQPHRPTRRTATGERRERDFEVWWKETRDPERKAHFCLVPGARTNSNGYNWAITVFIKGEEAWTYQSGSFFRKAKPSRRYWIDCVVSEPLPEGRLRFRTKLKCFGDKVC